MYELPLCVCLIGREYYCTFSVVCVGFFLCVYLHMSDYMEFVHFLCVCVRGRYDRCFQCVCVCVFGVDTIRSVCVSVCVFVCLCVCVCL